MLSVMTSQWSSWLVQVHSVMVSMNLLGNALFDWACGSFAKSVPEEESIFPCRNVAKPKQNRSLGHPWIRPGPGVLERKPWSCFLTSKRLIPYRLLVALWPNNGSPPGKGAKSTGKLRVDRRKFREPDRGNRRFRLGHLILPHLLNDWIPILDLPGTRLGCLLHPIAYGGE